jgi:hypothetical protein
MNEQLKWLVLWGLLATVGMTTILQGAQGLGLSRLSLPFLVGTFFTSVRRHAVVLGYIVYMIGGWLFAFIYFFIFQSVGIATWWFGAALGFLHGLFLLVGALPLLPYIHPRMASEHHGLSALRRLEPPGFMALNYGYRTPLTTVIAQTLYGAILGGFLQFGQ